jgi:hypothetical protein
MRLNAAGHQLLRASNGRLRVMVTATGAQLNAVRSLALVAVARRW